MSEMLIRVGLGAAALALLLVGLVRFQALRHGVLDHPTERSSHSTATPRGGGLGLILAFLVVAVLGAGQSIDRDVVLLLAGAAIVAAVGLLDDRRGLTVRIRLLVHLVAGSLVGVVAASGAGSPLVRLLLWGWWTFWTISSINLVNFMDGINGLVTTQIAVFAIALALLVAGASPTAVLAAALAGACVGFLPWNFPHARIFMGDVGSGALGYLVPALALLAQRAQGTDFVAAHLPLLPLYADATWTIMRRWRNGERVTTAHRSHLYQRLANGGMGHTAVTMIYAAVALAGALAAQAGKPSQRFAWTAAYVVATTLVGLGLHRRASRSASTAA
jgi:UDP-N-acetylmuramyl pentapeptide phosphotransferase/UDP-N-acetylglucosamine-1-phosphate transferase